jgi:hypothetical protein
MSTRKKVFLPKWQRWFIIPFFIGIWLLITYMEFFSPKNSGEMGLVGYIFMSILFLGLAVMMWLMTKGRKKRRINSRTREKKSNSLFCGNIKIWIFQSSSPDFGVVTL